MAAATETAKPKNPPSKRALFKRRMAVVSRWLHVYLSMVSFAIVLFFAATGLTLNHTEWFDGQQRTVTVAGAMPVALLSGPDQLHIVEQLRNEHHIHGALSDFRTDDDQIEVSFKGPGYTADTSIARATGKYEMVETRNGFVAVMNDLHKGRDSGKAWGWVIDVSAVLLVLVSLSGLVLIFFVIKRRTAGLIVAAVGAVVSILLYRLFVP